MPISISALLGGGKYRKINYRMLLKVMSWLIMLESLFMLVPLFVAWYYDESAVDAFAITAAFTFGCGFLANRFSRPVSRTMAKREGYLLTGMTWVIFSLFGMLPFIISDAPYSVIEAFTEAISAFTTSGAAIVPDSWHLDYGINIWRSLMQWIGGMGILVFTIAIIPTLNDAGGMQMFNAEATGITHEKIHPRISETAKSLWVIYISLTAIIIALFAIGPMDMYDSVSYGLITMATGGGGAHSEGLNHFNSHYIKVVASVFMILGSINFALIFQTLRGRYRSLKTSEPLRVLLGINLVMVIVFLVSRLIHIGITDWWDAIVDTVFIVASATSTTSYSEPGVVSWGPVVLILLILMMFFGGCAGSTSGGAKIDRLIVLVKYARNEVLRALQPNNITSVRLGKRTLQYTQVMKVIGFLCLDIILILAATLFLAVIDVPVTDALYSCISAVCNSCMCLDIGTYGGSFAPIPDAGKLVLAFVMLVGRLELYTILVLFTRNFWHK